MELPRGSQSTKEFWINHFQQAEKFNGSNKLYCERNKLNLKTFGQYKIKYGFTTPKPKKVRTQSFSKIEVKTAEKVHLPDPKWLAEFLKAWGSVN